MCSLPSKKHNEAAPHVSIRNIVGFLARNLCLGHLPGCFPVMYQYPTGQCFATE